MTAEKDSFARVYDVEDDDFGYDRANDDLFGPVTAKLSPGARR